MLLRLIKTYCSNEVNVFIVSAFILVSLYLNFFLPRFYASEFVIAVDSGSFTNANLVLSERKINAFFLAEIVSLPYFYEKYDIDNEAKLKTFVNELTGSIKFRFNSYNRDGLIKDTYNLYSLLNSRISEILSRPRFVNVVVLEKPYLESYIPIRRIVFSLIIGMVLGFAIVFLINVLFITKNGKIKTLPSPPSNLPIIS